MAAQGKHMGAQGQQWCCTRPAYGYTGLENGCTGPAIVLHRASIWLDRACNCDAQGQHVAAWGPQFNCTRPAFGRLGPAILLHMASL